MNPVIHSEKQRAIVYDADRVQDPDSLLFSPESWQRQGAVTGHASGRGTTWFLETRFGPAVLRPYLRGGWPAKISRDRYLYFGFRRSRPFREFAILRQLSQLELPVPAPLAACCEWSVMTCSGALLMDRIPEVQPLSKYVGTLHEGNFPWAETGRIVRRFHQAGLDHRDLNADNLLVNPVSRSIFMVDFDRCVLTPEKMVQGAGNLQRLRRSLSKLWPATAGTGLEDCWQPLLEAYHD